MFFKEIELKNYKCFEQSKFTFEKRFTAIIGDNGSGKTALLDAIAKGLGLIVANLAPNIKSSFYMYFKEEEIRTIPNKMGSRVFLEKMSDCKLKFLLNNKVSWFIGRSGGNSQDLDSYTHELETNVQKGQTTPLPLIAYYRTKRHWDTRQIESVEPSKLSSRLDTYNDCLGVSTNFKALYDWFSRMDYILYKRRQSLETLPELEAVQNALIEVLKSLNQDKAAKIDVYFDPSIDKTGEIMVSIGDDQEFPIRMLSDGYRNTLGMVADIAYRMAELNPHERNNSPGIVLIDELDLHLHPKWQRHIVGDLKRIFPNCQFIVTTHSPFIIQSLESGELLKLDDTPEIEHNDFNKKGIEDIVEEFQDVEMPQRSAKFQEMLKVAEEYYNLIEQGATNGKLIPLRKRLTELEERYSEEPAFVALLKAERKSKNII